MENKAARFLCQNSTQDNYCQSKCQFVLLMFQQSSVQSEQTAVPPSSFFNRNLPNKVPCLAADRLSSSAELCWSEQPLQICSV